MVGDPAYRAPVQRSNIHGSGERLSGDVQLRSQVVSKKTLIVLRVNEDLDRFRLVSTQHEQGEQGK